MDDPVFIPYPVWTAYANCDPRKETRIRVVNNGRTLIVEQREKPRGGDGK